ncbi:MAG: MmcQ/YjbR family DNA-binding protein [Dinoroseobacter sp.]|nr:MmcQ/YjbR family DNA-binding protein [Dinoroseobacter sp.]
MSDLRNRVSEICSALPGAEASDPWGGGHEAWKVGGKMFVCFGSVDPGVSVKTPDVETATMLIDAQVARKARYFHRSWVNLPDDVADEELTHRIVSSYDIVRGSLTKKMQAALAAREGA